MKISKFNEKMFKEIYRNKLGTAAISVNSQAMFSFKCGLTMD